MSSTFYENTKIINYSTIARKRSDLQSNFEVFPFQHPVIVEIFFFLPANKHYDIHSLKKATNRYLEMIDFIKKTYYRYTLMTGIYMLGPTETLILHTMIGLVLGLFTLYAYHFLQALLLLSD